MATTDLIHRTGATAGSATSAAVEMLESMAIDLDDTFRPRTMKECLRELPEAVESCRKKRTVESAVEVCDYGRSLLAAHLREQGDPAIVRALLESALPVVSAAGQEAPLAQREQVQHFLQNITFRIQVVDELREHGEAAAQRLIDARQVTLAERLLD